MDGELDVDVLVVAPDGGASSTKARKPRSDKARAWPRMKIKKIKVESGVRVLFVKVDNGSLWKRWCPLLVVFTLRRTFY